MPSVPSQRSLPQASPRRRSRRAIVISILLILPLVTGIGVKVLYEFYLNPTRVRQMAVERFERVTRRPVQIGGASFSLRDGIRLTDVRIMENAEGAPNDMLFSCPDIHIGHDPWSLLEGRLVIKSFLASNPTCTLVHDADAGWSSLATWIRDMAASDPTSLSPPVIELRDARVQIIHRNPESRRVVENLDLTVRGRGALEDPQLYNLVWQAVDSSASGHSQIDLRTGLLRNVHGGLPTMSADAVMLAVDAEFDGADALGNLLGLTGRVWARDYNLIESPGGATPRSATIDLEQASLSIPVTPEERELPADQRYLRFDAVRGSIVITADKVRADFSGQFHGSMCNVQADIGGELRPGMTLDDFSLDAKLTASNLELPRLDHSPEHRRFIQRWPQIARFYQNYDPHGRIGLDVHVRKSPGRDAPLIVREATLTAAGGDASSRLFPYRGENLSGSVRFTPEAVHIQDICGRHDAALICVDGRVAPPTRTGAADIRITGARVPIDDSLYDGLKSHHRSLLESFAPQGDFDAQVTLTRAESNSGAPAPWRRAGGITFDNLAANFVHWPYPVDRMTGAILLEDRAVEVRSLAGRAGEAVIALEGNAQFEGPELMEASFQIEAAGMAVDDRLVSAFPRAAAEQIERFHPRGCADIQLDLAYDSNRSEWRYDTRIQVERMAVTYEPFPVPVTDLFGRLHVSPNVLQVEMLDGRYGPAHLTSSGQVGWAPGVKTNLTVDVQGFVPDAEFGEALPPATRDAVAQWRLETPIGLQLCLESDPDRLNQTRWEVNADLSDAALRYARFQLPFRDIHATVVVDPFGVRSTGFDARYGQARLSGDFGVQIAGDTQTGRIRLDASGVHLHEGIHDILPAGLLVTWDKLRPAGIVDVRLKELSFVSEKEGKTLWSVAGGLIPRQVTLAGLEGSPTMHVGTVNIQGAVVDARGGTSLKGSFEDASIGLFGHRISGARGEWSCLRTAHGQGHIGLDHGNGQIYGGTVALQAEMDFDAGGSSYALAAAIQGMQLAPYLETLRSRQTPPPTSGGEVQGIRGTVDANLYLAKETGVAARRGGGRVTIRDGYIYRLPVFLAILNVLDITVSNNDVLDEARGDFYLNGDTVTLSDIVVHGDALSLVGGGTLSLPDQSIDVTLVNMGAGRLARVPVLAELWEGASRELIELRVTGPFAKPTVRASPFRGISDELKQIFQKQKQKKMVQAANP